MGFTKAAYHEENPISLTFDIRDYDRGVMEVITVTHFFRLPTARERDLYEQKRIQVKGRKIKHYAADARWFMWNKLCLRVDGYDDLPQIVDPEDPTKHILDPKWKTEYFTDDKGRIQVDAFLDRFMESLQGDDADFEKKSEPSSEQ